MNIAVYLEGVLCLISRLLGPSTAQCCPELSRALWLDDPRQFGVVACLSALPRSNVSFLPAC